MTKLISTKSGTVGGEGEVVEHVKGTPVYRVKFLDGQLAYCVMPEDSRDCDPLRVGQAVIVAGQLRIQFIGPRTKS